MRNALLILMAFAEVANAQSTFLRTAGELFCGMVKRSSDTVQAYCYAPGNKLVFNTIQTVHDRVIVVYQWKRTIDPTNPGDFDCVTWSVKWINDTEMQGDYTSSVQGVESTLQTFKLTIILGASGPGCGLLLTCQWPQQFPCTESDPPYFKWATETKQCLSYYAGGSWLECCHG